MKNKGLPKILIGICLILVLHLALPGVSGCGAKQYKIGITQIVTHPALDANRQGFIDQMAEEGFVEGENVTYIYDNPEGDMTLAATIAQKFVSENTCSPSVSPLSPHSPFQ